MRPGGAQFLLPLPDWQPALADIPSLQSNNRALALLKDEASWPGPVVAIHGPARSGVSTLLRAWAMGSLSAGRRIIDDACRIADLENGRRDLLAAFQAAEDTGARLLLGGRSHPRGWVADAAASPDLASRLRAVTAVALEPPGEDALRHHIRMALRRRHMNAPDTMLAYASTRIGRSYAEAAAFSDALCAAAAREERPPGLNLARRLLDNGKADRACGDLFADAEPDA